MAATTKPKAKRKPRAKAPAGDPKYTVWLQLLVTPEQKATIESIAKRRDITQSEWVRLAIDNYAMKDRSRTKSRANTKEN